MWRCQPGKDKAAAMGLLLVIPALPDYQDKTVVDNRIKKCVFWRRKHNARLMSDNFSE